MKKKGTRVVLCEQLQSEINKHQDRIKQLQSEKKNLKEKQAKNK